MTHIQFGEHSSWQLDFPPNVTFDDCSQPRGIPLDDPVAAVAAALVEPLDFPTLSQATVPGDRVVLALEPGLPQAAAVVAGIVHTLLEGHSRTEDISILRDTSNESGELPTCPLSLLKSEIRDRIELAEHDPTDADQLAYLATAKDGKAIYLNRLLADADVVLPVGIARSADSPGYTGVHGALFPTFSDEETQQRFRAPGSHTWKEHRRRRREEVEEAAWLLGVQFAIQVIPGLGDSILHVLTGDSRSVDEEGERLHRQAWSHEVRKRASLVVVTIDGGRNQQTWDSFARALSAASQAVEDNGTIVLCTEIDRTPGPSLQRLGALAGGDSVLGDIRRDRGVDALSANMLAELRDRARVCLLSGLPGEVVESLGLGHIAGVAELQRLSEQFESCIVLGGAQHAVLSTQEG